MDRMMRLKNIHLPQWVITLSECKPLQGYKTWRFLDNEMIDTGCKHVNRELGPPPLKRALKGHRENSDEEIAEIKVCDECDVWCADLAVSMRPGPPLVHPWSGS